jgi:hypothetical protein
MTSSKTCIQAPYRFVFPRASVEVHLPDGRVIEGPRGTPVGNFLKLVENQTAPSVLDPTAPIVGAVVNGELRELTYPITIDSRIRPVTMAESDGMLIYRRSLTFLLDAAFEDLFPEANLTIDHSVSFGGYYCRVSDMKRLSANKLERLERHMRKLVTANLSSSVKYPSPKLWLIFKPKAIWIKCGCWRTVPKITWCSTGWAITRIITMAIWCHPPVIYAGLPSARPMAGSRCALPAAPGLPKSSPCPITPSCCCLSANMGNGWTG